MASGWFFTQAALLTFGGAYAVLPYVNQAVIEQYQWLSTAQMTDGPLIMVAAFAGFVGGWTRQVAGGAWPERLAQYADGR